MFVVAAKCSGGTGISDWELQHSGSRDSYTVAAGIASSVSSIGVKRACLGILQTGQTDNARGEPNRDGLGGQYRYG